MKIVPIMSEPLGLFEIPNDEQIENKLLIQEIVKKAPSDFRLKDTNNTGLLHICNNRKQNIFKDFPETKNISSSIIKFSKDYINQIGYLCEDFIITDAWLNVGGLNATQAPHNHTNSFISGTYYINYSDNHSPLTFYNDRLTTSLNNSQPYLTLEVNPSVKTTYNNNLYVKPKEGQIILWRSHLVHGFGRNNAEDRITLSFNLMPKICVNGNAYSFSVSEETRC